MTELDPNQSKIDGLLRRSMSSPVPDLPRDFDRQVLRRVRRRSTLLERHLRILLSGYGLLSVLVSAILMRSQGLDWITIAGMTLAPLVIIAVVRGAARASRPARANS
ncbi:MAG TPA: hypothetical protein VMV81_13785 [Phycisphaerae bacterium]|nr:hypothetical protein [Phycisphaerae bacterium]